MADVTINELSTADSLNNTDLFIVEQASNGTRATTLSTMKNAVLGEIGSIFGTNSGARHNSIARGKSLGSSVSTAQWSAINSGAFTDMYIGDYWEINSIRWTIAAFDYYYGTGNSTQFNNHHIVIIPATALYNKAMHSSNSTTSGYSGTTMFSTATGGGLKDALTAATSAFGSGHIATIEQYFTSASENGAAKSGAWQDAQIWLMSENNVYGGARRGHENDVGSLDKTIYPLFAVRPAFIRIASTWWLRDICSAENFAMVRSSGLSSSATATTSSGVRPAFCIVQP